MNNIYLLILSILPALFLLWYFERQDKGRKEPLRLKWKIFGWGIIATFFAAVIELNIEDLYNLLGIQNNFWLYIFLSAFVTAAITEEALKFWVVKRHVYKDKHFDEIMDGITYTIIASLGFATLENIFYVLEGGFAIGIIRALLSVPAHALFSGIMGYYIGKAKFAPAPWIRRNLLWKGFGFAVLYHGLFNFLLFTESILILLIIPLFIIMILHLRSKILQARFDDKLTKVIPKKFTLQRVVKIFFGTLFIVAGVGNLIGAIMLYNDSSSGFSDQNIITSIIFSVILLALSYPLLKKTK